MLGSRLTSNDNGPPSRRSASSSWADSAGVEPTSVTRKNEFGKGHDDRSLPESSVKSINESWVVGQQSCQVPDLKFFCGPLFNNPGNNGVGNSAKCFRKRFFTTRP